MFDNKLTKDLFVIILDNISMRPIREMILPIGTEIRNCVKVYEGETTFDNFEAKIGDIWIRCKTEEFIYYNGDPIYRTYISFDENDDFITYTTILSDEELQSGYRKWEL